MAIDVDRLIRRSPAVPTPEVPEKPKLRRKRERIRSLDSWFLLGLLLYLVVWARRSATVAEVPLRTLVVVLGNLRGGERAWESLYKNLLEVNNADLALLVGDTRPVYHNASIWERAKYVWPVHEYDDWADAVDLVEGGSQKWRRRLLPLVNEDSVLMGGIHGHRYRGSGAIIFMMRYLLSQQVEKLGLLEQYDRFVVTRSDHYYLCPHDLSELDPSYIWIPEGEDYGGLTDRHHIISKEHLLQALDILPPVIRQPENYAQLLGKDTANPERLIATRWQEEGLIPYVRRFPRVMFTCGQVNDRTRWKQMRENPTQREGVHLKYWKEYRASYRTCGYCPGGFLWVTHDGQTICATNPFLFLES